MAQVSNQKPPGSRGQDSELVNACMQLQINAQAKINALLVGLFQSRLRARFATNALEFSVLHARSEVLKRQYNRLAAMHIDPAHLGDYEACRLRVAYNRRLLADKTYMHTHRIEAEVMETSTLIEWEKANLATQIEQLVRKALRQDEKKARTDLYILDSLLQWELEKTTAKKLDSRDSQSKLESQMLQQSNDNAIDVDSAKAKYREAKKTGANYMKELGQEEFIRSLIDDASQKYISALKAARYQTVSLTHKRVYRQLRAEQCETEFDLVCILQQTIKNIGNLEVDGEEKRG